MGLFEDIDALVDVRAPVKRGITGFLKDCGANNWTGCETASIGSPTIGVSIKYKVGELSFELCLCRDWWGFCVDTDNGRHKTQSAFNTNSRAQATQALKEMISKINALQNL